MTSNTSGTNPQRKLILIASAVIVALLAVNIILLVGRSQQARAKKQLVTQLDESEQLKAELEKEYYTALSELEEMRGSNEELNALIEKQKAELGDQKNRIDRLLRDNRNLGKAREEIKALNAKVQEYLAEVNQLRQENEQLIAEKEELSEQNQELSTTLQTARQTNEELSSARAALLTEKQQLEQTRDALAKKVNVASVIKVEGIEVEGLMERSTGKMVAKRRADNIDQLQVCFKTSVNEVAGMGTEVFLIRILNPSGETIAIDDLGSGIFRSNETNDEMRYTLQKELDYEQEEVNVCANWVPGQPFAAGLYTVEIYNKGYLAGSGNFELR